MKSSNAAKIGHTVWLLAGLMLGGLFGKAGASLATEYTWAQKADMPSARLIHSASAVDGKIYVIGGCTSEPNSVGVLPVEVYDPIADSWAQGAHIPTVRVGLATAVVDGKIYAIGGGADEEVFSTMEVYDPATDTWTTKSDMRTPTWFHAASVVDGKIYAIGGASSWTNPVGLSTVEEYDPVTDTWTPKANMPFGVWGLCTAVVDGKIYALGGRPGWQASPYVQEYDPVTDTWTRKADMPVATSNMASAVLGDKIIVIGGWLLSVRYPYTEVQMYDPETDIWTLEGDAPFSRASFSTSVVNNRLYAIGGTDRPHPCPATSTVYELTVSGPPPDFNGDQIVDFRDFSELAQYWMQDESSVDIYPPPEGDGVIDAWDVITLCEYWLREIPGDPLVAHWKLDETDGDIAYDSAGDNDATVHNGAWTEGRIDGALDLNGLTTYLDCGESEVLGPEKMTLTMWLSPEHMGGMRYVLARANESTDVMDYMLMRQRYGELELAVGQLGSDPVSALSTGQTPLEEWSHVAVRMDGSEASIYINGLPDAAINYGERIAREGHRLIISSYQAETRFYHGKMDDVRIYNIALSAEEVIALYHEASE